MPQVYKSSGISKKIFHGLTGTTATTSAKFFFIGNESGRLSEFTSSSGDTVWTSASAVMIAVPAGTRVDKIYISATNKLNEAGSYIQLEGDEIVTFTRNGTYVIDSIQLTV